MPRVERVVDVDAPPAVLMDVLTDFAAYPTFLDEPSEATVRSSDGGSWEVGFRVRVVRDFAYVLRLTKATPTDLRWSLVEGPFRANEGGWALEPLAGGTSTRARYWVDLQMGMYVPNNIVRSLSERALPLTLEAFKREAEARAASGGHP